MKFDAENISFEKQAENRIFELDINSKKKLPCAEARVERAVFSGVHGEINAFCERLCNAFLAYAQDTLAPEFAARYKAAETVRERASLKIPVLTVTFSAKLPKEKEAALALDAHYTLSFGARTAKKGNIRTDWNAEHGVMVKKNANRKRSARKA